MTEVPGDTPTSPVLIVDSTPAKVTVVLAWTAKFAFTVLLETVLGAGDFKGALLGVEVGHNEIDGLRLGTELGAIDVGTFNKAVGPKGGGSSESPNNLVRSGRCSQR